MSEALAHGLSRWTVYAMRDAGLIEALGRGLYRLTELPPLSDPDLVLVARKLGQGIICLTSALSFHGLTTQVPHHVDIAVPRGAEPPRMTYPPVRIYWFSEPAFSSGVETRSRDGVDIRLYSPEKTIADCFKYRHKLGMDIVLEALRMWRQERRGHMSDLMRYAQVCRVAKVMRPYLEAGLR